MRSKDPASRAVLQLVLGMCERDKAWMYKLVLGFYSFKRLFIYILLKLLIGYFGSDPYMLK